MTIIETSIVYSRSIKLLPEGTGIMIIGHDHILVLRNGKLHNPYGKAEAASSRAWYTLDGRQILSLGLGDNHEDHQLKIDKLRKDPNYYVKR